MTLSALRRVLHWHHMDPIDCFCLPFLELVVARLYVLPIGAAAGVIVREVKLR